MERSSGGRGEAANVPVSDADLVSRSCELEDVSFGAVLDAADGERVQWTTPDGLEIVGCGVAASVDAAGTSRCRRIHKAADRVFDGLEHDGPPVARPRAFGGLSFHDGHEPAPPWNGFEAASFVVPSVLVTRDDSSTWLTVVTDEGDVDSRLERWRNRLADLPAMRPSGTSPGVASTRRTTSRGEWVDQVETALERIDGGGLEKVVLAQALAVDLERALDVPATLERLRRRYPNCYRFLFEGRAGATFFGTPPERLVAKRGHRVETEALAGSVPRGETHEKDDEYVERMVDSEKFQREHGLVVDSIRQQLEALGAVVTVADQTIRRLATIQHLRTPIEAELEADSHVLEFVEALHPTPAVGGVPPGAAWETIRSVETFDRGWYAAPIGWFDAAGDGEFAVGIRSGVATDDRVTLFAGNGIVADSDPDEEWEEVQLKFRPILDEL